jgi:EF-P beta-lysylation protein EpmB
LPNIGVLKKRYEKVSINSNLKYFMHLSLIKETSWTAILRKNLRHLEQLANFLELTQEQKKRLLDRPHFPLNLPLRLAQKIAKQTLDDPLLKQFIPLQEERLMEPGFVADPVGDGQACRQSNKLLHKYEGRVLLVCTSACAMHCRYCFRQNFDYDTSDKLFAKELAVIVGDLSIHEVILSGGDPLSLSDRILSHLLMQLNQMPHIKRIRFHTRFPIGIPERIDAGFLSIIQKLDKQIWFVIHANHPRELDADVFAHLKDLQKLGCTILNQSVLLKGVNDNVETLKQLCEMLADQGILPYYLHQLDRVQGAAHFEVQEEVGQSLIKQLARSLPGYAVPKYVREIAGQPHKTIIK